MRASEYLDLLWPGLHESHRPALCLRERRGIVRKLGGRLGLQIGRQQTHLHRFLLGYRVAHRGVKRLARSE